MIIYGSRMYFKQDQVTSYGECEHCGAFSRMTSYKAQKFGHIYFIPLIPMSSKSQILRECKNCDMGMQIPLNDMEPRVASLTEKFKTWIVEIQSGNRTTTMEDGTEINLGLLISGIIEDMYCLKEIEGVDHIVKILVDNGMHYESNLVLAQWYEIKGDLKQSAASLKEAHQLEPEDSIVIFRIGRAEVKLQNVAGAEAAFQKYMQLEPEDVSAWIELATMYEGMKDYPNIVRTYDEIYSMNEQLVQEKAMKKVYKKACKKSGQQGKYLSQM